MNAQNRAVGVAAGTLTLTLLAGCTAAGGRSPEQVRATPVPAALADLDLARLEAALNDSQASSEQLVRALLERAGARASLNALISIDADAALARARELDRLRADGITLGPLHGVPLVVKDNIHVTGFPNTAGTPALADFRPRADSPVIARLRQSGAIILAKSNMHELAFGITSNNAAWGAVGNPAAPGTFAGGSSGGTASAVAAGIAPAGLGTDTGGSVRIPAALTGLAGLRPTLGRYSQAGVTPLSTTRDTIGPIARSVADVAVIDAVITGEEEALVAARPSALRIGVPRGYFYENLDAGTAGRARDALAALAAAGVTLVEADVPALADLVGRIGFPVVLYEAPRLLEEYLRSYDTGIDLTRLRDGIASPDVAGVFGAMLGEAQVGDVAYAKALEARETLRGTYRDYFADNRLDAMIFPTTPLPARPIEGSDETVELNGERVPTFPTYIRNTDPASLAGLPGLTIPAGETPRGLPVGMEIDGPEGSDRRLLAIGLTLEALMVGKRP